VCQDASAHNYAYVMSIIKRGETIQGEPNRRWRREIEHDFADKVTFPMFIDCVFQEDGTANTE